MNDRVVGVFEDRPAAEAAMTALHDSGIESDRMTVKRVLQPPTHRGFANSETVHSLVHAPEIREDDRTSQDAGTVILVVEMPEPSEESDEPPTSSTSDHHSDNETVMRRLDELGATETNLVPATPPLDL